MSGSWLHRCSILAVVCTLGLIVAGAALKASLLTRGFHMALAGATGLLILTLAISASATRQPSSTKWLAWIAAAIVLVQGAPLPEMRGFVHALLAQILFAVVATLAVLTSRAWGSEPQTVQDYGWPSLRSLAIVTPLAVIAQVTLGAAFRHDRMTLLPHILGALIVSMIILITCAFVLHQFPQHRGLSVAAKAFMGIAFAQVFVGMFAYSMRAVPNAAAAVTGAVGIAHVAIGALTLAASMVLCVQIRRSVRPAAETSSNEAGVTAS